MRLRHLTAWAMAWLTIDIIWLKMPICWLVKTFTRFINPSHLMPTKFSVLWFFTFHYSRSIHNITEGILYCNTLSIIILLTADCSIDRHLIMNKRKFLLNQKDWLQSNILLVRENLLTLWKRKEKLGCCYHNLYKFNVFGSVHLCTVQ
jgi:hypothetical protein